MTNDDIANKSGQLRWGTSRQLRRAWLQAAEDAEIGLFLSEPHGRLRAVNRSLALKMGFEHSRALLAYGQSFGQLFVDPGLWASAQQEALISGQAARKGARLRRRDGSVVQAALSLMAVPGPGAAPCRLQGLLQVLPNGSAVEDDVLRNAFHDMLTGLPNRSLFLDRVEQALHRCRREPQRKLALLFITLDGLGRVNESLGHRIGDQLLAVVAGRLQAAVRPSDSLARLSGNCLAVLLDDCGEESAGLGAVKRLRAKLAEPLELAGEEMEPTAGMGLAFGGAGTGSADAILQDAESALQRALQAGRDQLVVFAGCMHAETAERISIEHGLRRAVERNEIWVAFQPVVRIESGGLLGFEALARWTHPRLGLVGPDRFIPAAEASGQIEALGARVLEIACARRQAWSEELAPSGPFFVSVNLSPRQLLSPNLVSLVGEVMARHGMGPGTLKLEITESLLVQEPQRSRGVMEALADLGATLWLDDFGTGYSSLGTLAQFPIQGIKLDRSFVRDLETSSKARSMLLGTMALAREMRMSVVAEGIETVEQEGILRASGCGLGQGYLYAKPLDERQARLFYFQGRFGAAPI